MRLFLLLFIAFNAFAESDLQFDMGLNSDIYIGEIDGVALTLNIALPEKQAKPSPVLVFIHGGGLVKGNKNKFNKPIAKMAERGITAVSVMYRFAPKYRFPAAIEDVKAAIRFLKAHAQDLNIDPDRIVVSGSSAGGYLATMVGVTGNETGFSDHGIYPDVDSSVCAVIAQSGSLGDFTHIKYRDFVLVKRFANDKQANLSLALAAVSPLTYLDKNDPPFFLSHGSDDDVVPVEMTREFVHELKKIGHDVEYIEVAGGKHSLSDSHPQQGSEVFSASMKFFKKQAF